MHKPSVCSSRSSGTRGPFSSHHDGGAEEPLQQRVCRRQLRQQAAHHHEVRKVAGPVLLRVVKHGHGEAAKHVEPHDDDELHQPPVGVLLQRGGREGRPNMVKKEDGNNLWREASRMAILGH